MIELAKNRMPRPKSKGLLLIPGDSVGKLYLNCTKCNYVHVQRRRIKGRYEMKYQSSTSMLLTLRCYGNLLENIFRFGGGDGVRPTVGGLFASENWERA